MSATQIEPKASVTSIGPASTPRESRSAGNVPRTVAFGDGVTTGAGDADGDSDGLADAAGERLGLVGEPGPGPVRLTPIPSATAMATSATAPASVDARCHAGARRGPIT